MKKAIYVIAALLAFASANGTTRAKSHIQVVYQPQPNGDYRLYLFGSDRTLVCEEKRLRIVQQGDAASPVVIECKH
jgi:hypothetical protein